MKDTGHYWPHTQLKTLYSDAFKMVVDCWAKCFEKQEDYAERQHNCNDHKMDKRHVGKKVQKLFKHSSKFSHIFLVHLLPRI
jgi:hypothetical protein